MPKLVSGGATLTCSFGAAPSTLVVPPDPMHPASCDSPVGIAANIYDCKPLFNIPPFGICAQLTSLASGTPTPCTPAIVPPWKPGSTVAKVGGAPALHDKCKCTCGVGGVISITVPGQMTADTV